MSSSMATGKSGGMRTGASGPTNTKAGVPLSTDGCTGQPASPRVFGNSPIRTPSSPARADASAPTTSGAHE